jgi:hypothetical protein
MGSAPRVARKRAARGALLDDLDALRAERGRELGPIPAVPALGIGLLAPDALQRIRRNVIRRYFPRLDQDDAISRARPALPASPSP